MRFIYSILFVVFSVVAKAARIISKVTGLFAGVIAIVAGVASYDLGVTIHAELVQSLGAFAGVIAVGSAIGAVIATGLAGALVFGATHIVAVLLTDVEEMCVRELERTFTPAPAPAPSVQAKVEQQPELPLPAVEREPNRRVPRRDVEPFPRAIV